MPTKRRILNENYCQKFSLTTFDVHFEIQNTIAFYTVNSKQYTGPRPLLWLSNVCGLLEMVHAFIGTNMYAAE